ncbi:leukocyte elastase inhibitor-like [Pollicipes pollicipes]|uniref:leukocyte elastase inhibitor-like n=1 Tax=Pollicipes pollicipes TaxID=41117 RepID=UPI001884E615|nr:leukocyte elastase inhibitor-like [Pollicipes pollicipes]
MGRSAVLVVLAALALCLAAQDQGQKKRGKTVVAESMSKFGMDMYSVMADVDKTSNIFFSPMSIGTALAMAYAGSRGETAEQMEQVLHLRGKRSRVLRGHRGLLRYMKRRYQDDVAVKLTNRMYVAGGLRLRSKFQRTIQRIFQAEITRLNFSRSKKAAATINKNVKEDTEGQIDSLVEPKMINDLTRLVLVNAIHFKGDWLMKFDKKRTIEADFHALTGTKKVPTMRARKMFPVGDLYDLDARILQLPYKGEDVQMMILLPNARDGIYELERRLADRALQDLSWSAEADYNVTVRLPKFKLEERVNLKLLLQQMGMADLFDEVAANMRGMSGREALYVTDAVHKAAVEVNEEGTEASAATALAFGFRTIRPRPRPFIVDRPFIFAYPGRPGGRDALPGACHGPRRVEDGRRWRPLRRVAPPGGAREGSEQTPCWAAYSGLA